MLALNPPARLTALVFIVTLLGSTHAAAELRTVKSDQGASYTLFLPSSYDAAKEWPLLTLFHWSTARSTSMITLWKEMANEAGIVLAVPDSRSRMRWTRRDAKHALNMITDVFVNVNIDPARVYAAGYSSGANFAYRLMADNPGLFRAVAPFSGRLLASDKKLGRGAAVGDTRVCIYHGKRDGIIKFKSGRRAATRLTRLGYEVHTRWLNQGHYFPKRYVPEIWRCLAGAPVGNDI
jgi:predicted esterase